MGATSADNSHKVGISAAKPAGNRGLGRKKGTRNKYTAEVKDMILQALDKAGGVDYLAKQAQANPGPFMTLVGKVLPLQVNQNSTHTFSQLPAKVDDFL